MRCQYFQEISLIFVVGKLSDLIFNLPEKISYCAMSFRIGHYCGLEPVFMGSISPLFLFIADLTLPITKFFLPSCSNAHQKICGSKQDVASMKIFLDSTIDGFHITEMFFHNQEWMFHFAAYG